MLSKLRASINKNEEKLTMRIFQKEAIMIGTQKTKEPGNSRHIEEGRLSENNKGFKNEMVWIYS